MFFQAIIEESTKQINSEVTLILVDIILTGTLLLSIRL